MSDEHEIVFRSMGSDVRIVVGRPFDAGLPAAWEAAERQRELIAGLAARLSRFRDDSELSAFNADPRREVPASLLLRAAVRAGLWAAERTGGLVDPTLVGALERVGYARSLEGSEPASLAEALAAAPERGPARPAPDAVWREIEVDDERGTIRRPPGVRFDSGGIGKGLAADAAAHNLAGHARFAVDCGGDIALGGRLAAAEPFTVEVEHPLTGEVVHTLVLAGGGVATSGLNVRIWRTPAGAHHHHLLDPASGRPVWSGLIGATAIGGSALEAETLSKAALLLGPQGARDVLAEHGGVIVHDDGEVELVGALRVGNTGAERAVA